jgi:glutamyl-tRNA synthetase
LASNYRGRIAPTPTGYLHSGHALTFHAAWSRAREAGGVLVYRDEDLDPHRCREEFSRAAVEDLRWLGLDWQEGPDVGGPHAPYVQSRRMARYLVAWEMLRDAGLIYPCTISRRQLRELTTATAPDDDEPLFPPDLRAPLDAGRDAPEPGPVNWRFRVPDGRATAFEDAMMGSRRFVAGRDFGDFLVWRRDGVPSYELAVVVDDIAMEITEVVRGQDLLKSTARQLLLYEALEADPPAWVHCPLVKDQTGRRLAKSFDSLAIRALRDQGLTPAQVLKRARQARISG